MPIVLEPFVTRASVGDDFDQEEDVGAGEGGEGMGLSFPRK